jgi:signal transduction histidine kinase
MEYILISVQETNREIRSVSDLNHKTRADLILQITVVWFYGV